MAKLRITATVEFELPSDKDELRRQYLADNYSEAVANQLEWIESGETDISDILSTEPFALTVDLVI